MFSLLSRLAGVDILHISDMLSAVIHVERTHQGRRAKQSISALHSDEMNVFAASRMPFLLFFLSYWRGEGFRIHSEDIAGSAVGS